MKDDILKNDNNTNAERIDLAYNFLDDGLKTNLIAMQNLRSRAATFLGFAGLLLRFILELSDSQPSYKFTKLLAFLTCFFSITLLGWTLSASYLAGIKDHTDSMENLTIIFLEKDPVEAKMSFIEIFKEAWKASYIMINKVKILLNISIVFLVFSAFFFTINGILVTFLGK